jgi:translin
LLEEVIKRASDELNAREKARDEVLNRARKARMLSKQAILIIHNKDFNKAEFNLVEAKKILEETKTFVHIYSELGFYDEVEAAKEEYSEAIILFNLQKGNGYPSSDELGVTSFQYLLGLADVPGELRREALDSLRVSDFDKAENYLIKMEEIYLNLIAMEDVSLLLKGLRRKLDIIRSVIEATRGDITAEAGRVRLNDSIKKLNDRLKS